MTFSILARDPETGLMGGGAATGSLCVGGWVLRGRADAGLSASQGASPSTLWGEAAVDALAQGQGAEDVVCRITDADRGRAFRQLAVLGREGSGAVFSGERNSPRIADQVFERGVAAGNLLASEGVIPALVDGFSGASGTFPEQLLAGLLAAQDAGSDARGLFSAALLVVGPDRAPLSLRIDHSEDPLGDLSDLLARATSGEYAFWARQVPTLHDPERILD
ncbi:DUF1028 domain-containing protein [Maritimibacter sp. UBA3975]|uniref:DUF1028 domain-containing protein n=1 Tax=Maritimibacter sp. UBA3975 TaxID=1946833 RepID=UPI000C0A8270|nr:DUF1028 domain-containing protein [Maritimibacter sp. UBA3975]MAM61586.1 fimbrial assembly protein FimA [Maritimibacter sp.]|tara:strand:+ start:13129 stop:13791 length:663 start_codon:yes stop_codon:yes gene_type:complete